MPNTDLWRACERADVDQHISRLEESRFYARLKQCCDLSGVGELITTVEKIWDHVTEVAKRVSRDFRDYTLHDMRHLGNVLWLMEQLVPPDFWNAAWKPGDPVGPLQCAVSILAALVHDLGMALPDDVRSRLLSVEDPQQPLGASTDKRDRDLIAYRRHFMAQEHDVRAIQTLRREQPAGYLDRIEHIRQQIRTEYLRQTHADDSISGAHRIDHWLGIFEGDEQKEGRVSFVYSGQPFRKQLAQVALSHGQSLSWLEGTFSKNEPTQWRNGERVSWIWTGWLLRLADILDFDASRAPRVLFRQFRPGNPTSRTHWYQHLCVGQRVFDWDKRTIVFRQGTEPCHNPDILKGVSDYCGWIRNELQGVGESQARHLQLGAWPLRLPGHQDGSVTHDVEIKEGWSSQPVRFELSQDQIVKILMGEELYGEPSLCLRELIQNSLDALHLRWLRSELRRRVYRKHGLTSGPGVTAPMELIGLPPVDDVRDKHELRVTVSWGEAELCDDRWPDETAGRNGRTETRSFIEISDNGVGMTFDIVQRFFTQIGKSYYQSDEYSHERTSMKEFELPVSEISQFGIGILSCFMLADLVEVWTCPSRADHHQRQPHHLRIWGPDGLFWHQPDENSSLHCGTRVRMWLRPGIVARCLPDKLVDDLRSYHFANVHRSLKTYEATANDGRTEVDPLRAIWSVAAWPRYAIQFQPPAGERKAIPAQVCDLDDVAVLKVLCTLHQDSIAEKRRELLGSLSLTEAGIIDPVLTDASGCTTLVWRIWDWEDLPTASRIRLAVPVVGAQIERVDSITQLFAESDATWIVGMLRRGLVEAGLASEERTRWVVRGMAVPQVKPLAEFMEFGHGVGTCCVVDLSGHPAPGLKSDRTALKRTQRDDWPPELKQLVARWRAAVKSESAAFAVVRSVEHGTNGQLRLPLNPIPSGPVNRWICPLTSPVVAAQLIVQEFGAAFLFRRIRMRARAHYESRTNVLDRNLVRDPDFALAFNFDESRALLEHTRALDLKLIRMLDRNRALARALAPALDRNRALSPNFNRTTTHVRGMNPVFLERNNTSLFARALTVITNRVATYARNLIATHMFSEGCYPRLRESSPILGLPMVDGAFVDGSLTAPLTSDFQITGELVKPTGGWTAPSWLERLGYELVTPLTLQPLGSLCEQVPDWGHNRALRAVGLLPFLMANAVEFTNLRKALSTIGFPKAFMHSGSILLLIPGAALLWKPFVESDRERDDEHVVSAFWDVPQDRVLWAEGFHDRDSICAIGRPLDDWLSAANTVQ